MANSTRYSVLKYAVETYALGRVAVNDNTSGITASISDDSQLSGRGGDRSVDVGADVRIRQNSDAADGSSGTNRYAEGRVATRPTFGAGLVTFDPFTTPASFETTIDADDNYTEALFLDLPLRFEDACNHLNTVIREYAWVKQIVPITMINDGDMLSTATSAWTASGGGTLAKNLASTSFAFPYRYLSHSDTGSSEYVTTAVNYAVEQGASYYYEVCAAKASANDCEVQLRDVTNSSDFTLSQNDIDERVPQLIINNVQMASTTEQVAPRITKADGTHTTVILWVILRPNKSHWFSLQDRPQKVLWAGELRCTTDDDFMRRSWTSMTPVAAKAVQGDSGLWQYHIDGSLSGRSLWYEEFIQPSVMDSDDDTTSIEIEDLAACMTEKWLAPHRDLPQWAARYEKAAWKATEARQRRMHQIQSQRQEAQYVVSPLGV